MIQESVNDEALKNTHNADTYIKVTPVKMNDVMKVSGILRNIGIDAL